MGLLQSALVQSEVSFWLHVHIFSMAAAYAFHICSNHPFIDSNKRTALACALVFLEMNSISINDSQGKLLDAMLKMVRSKFSKQEFTNVLKKLAE